MIKNLKEHFYFLKVWYGKIFLYPRDKIVVGESLDYDRYWEVKRGDDVGVLSDWQKIRADIVLSILSKDKPITIGDIGCGEGSILKYLTNQLFVTRAIGYDSSDFVLDKARQIGIETVQFDINKDEELVKIEPADYHLILEVLEHIPHSEKLLNIAYDRANRGVFFSFPNSGFFVYRLRLLFGKFPKQWINFPNEHLRFWTDRDLKWWLKALGYENYKIFYYKGVPILNKIRPSLFAAGFVVYLRKEEYAKKTG